MKHGVLFGFLCLLGLVCLFLSILSDMEQLLFSGGSDMHTFFFQLQILDIHGLRSLGQSGQINFNGLQQMCGISSC